MHGNWIKCTTATTGTGNLTLSAVTGFPAFSDVFALNQPFSYVLLDSDGKPLESGLGHLSGSTTLVRSKVKTTYSGSTYTNKSATAANLAGTTTVIAVPQASTIEAMLPTVDATSASVGRYVSAANRTLPGGTQAVTTDRLYHVPFLYRCGAVITSMAINVTTLQASSKARCGIYAMDENGYPGALLAETGDMDTTSTGFKTSNLASSIWLPPGWYFSSFVSNAGITITPYTSGVSAILGGGPCGFASGGITAIDFRREALSSGWTSLPATASASTTADNVAVGHVPAALWGVN